MLIRDLSWSLVFFIHLPNEEIQFLRVRLGAK